MSEQNNTDEKPEIVKNGETPWEAVTPGTNQISRAGFSGMELAGQGPATAALVARQRANIESRFIMAMHRPRSMAVVRQNIITECRRPGFAETAVYHVPRGGKTIDGLSIRFAEVAARCYGNMPVETVTIFESDEDRIMECTVTDLESNVTFSEQITVKKTVERKILKQGQRPIRERMNSSGERVFIVEATDDDMTMKANSMISKTIRKLILRLIPGNLKQEAKELCEEIARDKQAKDPDAFRNRMVDSFDELGVRASDLEAYFDAPIANLTIDQARSLVPIFNAIKEGELTWRQVMDERREERKDGAPPAKPAAKTTASAPATKPVDPKATDPKATDPKADPKAGGKGAAAAKAAIKSNTSQTPAAKTDPAPAQAAPPKEEKTIAEPAPDIKPAPAAPAVEPAPAADAAPFQLTNPSPSDYEMRSCAECSEPIEVKKSDPPNAICDACRNA